MFEQGLLSHGQQILVIFQFFDFTVQTEEVIYVVRLIPNIK